MDYHVANVSHFPKTPASTTPGQTPTDDSESRHSTWLMTREEALVLLQDFIENPFHLLTIIHAPAAKLMVDNFYRSLAQGEDPNPAHAALILSIAATSAFFYNEGSKSLGSFTSTEEATHTALGWFKSALNILEKSRPSTYSCLEEVQARSVLAYLVYNMEGCSARFRFLHSCSLAAARENCLHLIDSPSSEQQDDVTAREIKRRVWWHIVSTDWMLGLMGGPTDGTYNVQPRQMNVKYPRNINDDEASLSDESFAMPPDTATMLSCFIKRIQLAEIARSIIDARAPGVPDAEVADYDKVLELDSLFEDALADFPSFLRPDGPIPANAPPYLGLQKDIVLLGFHSRRARLHRPFLLHDKQDAQYQPSREICLRSARTVLSIATSLLRASQDRGMVSALNVRAMSCRLGCVIGHMFMACTILALNAGLDPSRGTPVADDGRGVSSDLTAETHAEVAQACRALASAGEESAVAEKLVRNLVGVLRRYRVQGVDDVVLPESERGVSFNADVPDDTLDEITATNKKAGGSNGDCDAGHSSMLGEDDLGLHELWDDMLGDTSAFGWDQLFAGLDTYCGPT
ncbi:putative transcription factor lepB [Colletotrichum liriopes]|uniref:Transcription factor lepB n=1 Tax=Colletotrichum liriopes TaxID=708192 RepID=A0AA37LV87_9PEZI|nr:putative transcription factor lepB [Colletotrichum liriopes]